MPTDKLKVIILTYSSEGAPMALRLAQEGVPVTLAIIKEKKDTLLPEEQFKPEDNDERKARLKSLEGLVDRQDAAAVVKRLLALPEEKRKEYFIFSDFNHNFLFSQQLYEAGFKGLLQTADDRRLETDRLAMKKIVEENYDLEVAPVHEFKTVDEAKKFLEENPEGLYVLKGGNEDSTTYVCISTDPAIAHQELNDQMDEEKALYESNGFILEELIKDCIEITPEVWFHNGELIKAMIGIELKKKFAGGEGQSGCSADLVFPIPLDSPIVDIAAPKWVHDAAKKHKGTFLWDCSLLIDPEDGTMYFGESCACRPGWNSFLDELALMPSVKSWIEATMDGRNPMDERIADFAASVRIFSESKKKEGVKVYGDIKDRDIWPMDLMKQDGKLCLAGYSADAVVATGVGEDPREALWNAAENVKKVMFKKMVSRPHHDLVSRDYQGNILNRWKYGWENGLYEYEPVKRILVDFDLTIADPETMEPLEGAVDALWQLANNYELHVFTARDSLDEVREWLSENGFEMMKSVTHEKIPADYYIDDSAIVHKSWAASLAEVTKREMGDDYDGDTTGRDGSTETLDLEADAARLQTRDSDWDDSYYEVPDDSRLTSGTYV